jgi:acyl-CoA thioesterase-2
MTSIALLPDCIEDGTGDGPVGRLLVSLQLKPAGSADCFVAAASGGEGFRMFGGHLLAQALVAARRTVTSGQVHAVQATFLRAGDRGAATTLHVQRLFDGRTYRVRQVTIEQVGQVLMTAMISFHDGEMDPAGDDPRRTTASLPPVAVGRLSPWSDQGGNATACPIELRRDEQEPATHPERDGPGARTPNTGAGTADRRAGDRIAPHDATSDRPPGWRRTWFKAAAGFPDAGLDELMHAALVAYASDLTAMESAMVAAGRHPHSDELTWATLSHTLWIHGTPRADRWIRCDQQTAVIGTDRALVHGSLIDESGSVVASFSQQGAMRVNRRRDELSRAA